MSVRSKSIVSLEPARTASIPPYQVAAPKLGIEVESIPFGLVGANEKDPLLKDDEYKTKGRILMFFVPTPSTDKPKEDQPSKLDPDLNGPKTNWDPTAEVQSSLKTIQMEMIYGGPTGVPMVPISDANNELGTVGAQISRFLKTLDDRTAEAKAFASNPGNAQKLDSVIGRPFMRPVNFVDESDPKFISNLAKSNAKIGWITDKMSVASGLGIHVTTSMPLAAVPYMVEEAKKFSEPLFGNKSSRENDAMVQIHPGDIKALQVPHFKLANVKWGERIRPNYGESSVAGLLIMICSYIKASASSPSDVDMNLKKKTPLMPRTDFKTMLDLTLRHMDDQSATSFRQDLLEVVARLTDFTKVDDLQNRFFNWEKSTILHSAPSSGGESTSQPPPSTDPPPPPKPPGPGRTGGIISTAPTLQQWNLDVKTWLTELAKGGADLIAAREKSYRGAQIGGLGNKIETLIGNGDEYCPILEFRGVGTCPPEKLAVEGGQNYFQVLLERIDHWHKVAREL